MTYRNDGRGNYEIRPLEFEFGIATNAIGSCRWTQGSTSVLAAVKAPTESKLAHKVYYDSGMLSVTIESDGSAHKSGGERDALEGFIQATLQQMVDLTPFPHSQVLLTLHLVTDDGGSAAPLFNAGMLALLHAGFEFYFTAFATTIGSNANNALLVDPYSGDEGVMEAFLYVIDIHSQKVVTQWVDPFVPATGITKLSEDNGSRALELARNTVKYIENIVRVKMGNYYKVLDDVIKLQNEEEEDEVTVLPQKVK